MESTSKYARLVVEAEGRRQQTVTAALKSRLHESASFSLEEFQQLARITEPWVRPLVEVNDHITIPQKDVDEAVSSYDQVANHLVAMLRWPSEAIRVFPQGSASTQTLIRTPNASNFDIDAVCAVDLEKVGYLSPMAFFEQIGKALERYEATKKKRCWRVPMSGKPFYLEFTPSVPLGQVPADVRESLNKRYILARDYEATALAVVDTPTRGWKPSNPEGMAKWVNDAAKLNLIREITVHTFEAKANVEPVPRQDVNITDTLRLAIRLFKRHRDMCVHRDKLSGEYQPISIILVTLLTSCYIGLADNRRTFSHPLQVLMELAELLPHLIVRRNGCYYVDNPTVEGENFAERWNGDGGRRYNAFTLWCNILIADLKAIMDSEDPAEIRSKVRHVFGCSDTGGNGGGFWGRDFTTVVPPVPPTKGLA